MRGHDAMLLSGNPADEEPYLVCEAIEKLMEESGLDDNEQYRAAVIGIAAVKAEREIIEGHIKDEIDLVKASYEGA